MKDSFLGGFFRDQGDILLSLRLRLDANLQQLGLN